MKNRKKPVIVEAFQVPDSGYLDPFQLTACPWLYEAVADGVVYRPKDELGLKIKTLEGEMLAGSGDYTIQGVQGELYPCKPDIFEATYELED